MLKPIMLSAFVVEIIILNVCTRLFYTVLKFISFESLMKASAQSTILILYIILLCLNNVVHIHVCISLLNLSNFSLKNLQALNTFLFRHKCSFKHLNLINIMRNPGKSARGVGGS